MKIAFHTTLFSLLTLAASSCAPKSEPNKGISTTDVTAQTKAVFEQLAAIQKSGTLFGHQDATVYGIGWKNLSGDSDVKKVTGQYPAVYGWEIGHIEMGDSVSLDSVSFSQIRTEAIRAYERGGINTISWHLRNPLTGDSSWDVSSDKVVASILPGGEKHALYLQWLDRLANYLDSFQTNEGEKAPLLFRPFHEHSGSWFWWGKELCTTNDYVSLYRFTIDYLRNVKNLKHLLIIYSPDRVADEVEYLERYPGDNYVDILGLDLYARDDSYAPTAEKLLKVVQKLATERQKPYVFSETGSEGVKQPDWFTKVLYPILKNTKPAYVLVWRNAYERPEHHFAPYPGHPAAADLIEFCNKHDIYFESEIPVIPIH